MTTDPIGDMLCSLNNANNKFLERVVLPNSKFKEHLARALKEKGYIAGYKISGDKKSSVIILDLKYTPGRGRMFEKMVRVSKPGLKIYRKHTELLPVLGGIGMWVVSTSKGIMTDDECRKHKVGGEVLCKVW